MGIVEGPRRRRGPSASPGNSTMFTPSYLYKMKKAILTLAVLCGIGLMVGCKSGTADENATDSAVVESRVYDMVTKGDTLLIVCDPEGLFFGQPLSERVSQQWIDSVYKRPGLRTLTDHEMYPHEEGTCTCGNETYTVVGENDTLQFAWYGDENGGWEYTWGIIADTLVDFAGIRVGMSIADVATRLSIPTSANVECYKVIHLVAPDLFTEYINEKQPGGYLKGVGQKNPYDYEYRDCPRIEYAGVELVVDDGLIAKIRTGWYLGGRIWTEI